jgi:hypothetical protein
MEISTASGVFKYTTSKEVTVPLWIVPVANIPFLYFLQDVIYKDIDFVYKSKANVSLFYIS